MVGLALAPYGFNPARLFAAAAVAGPAGTNVFLPSPRVADPVALVRRAEAGRGDR